MATTATQPYNVIRAITTSDANNLQPVGGRSCTDAIYIGGAGTLAVVQENDAVATFTCVAGQTLPVKAKRVNATGTTATLLNALYVI